MPHTLTSFAGLRIVSISDENDQVRVIFEDGREWWLSRDHLFDDEGNAYENDLEPTQW